MDVALVDVETTGRDASVDRVVELGIVVGRRGEIVAQYNWIVNPQVRIPPEATQVHGISDEMVADKPVFADVAAEVSRALAGCVPAAYNAPFDRAFVQGEFSRLRSGFAPEASVFALLREIEWLDPLVWARAIQESEKSRALGDVAARLGIELASAHRAQHDAEAALRVLYLFASDPKMPTAYGALVQEQRRLSQLQADLRRQWRN